MNKEKVINFEDKAPKNIKSDTQKNLAKMDNAEANNYTCHFELQHHTFPNEDPPYIYQIQSTNNINGKLLCHMFFCQRYGCTLMQILKDKFNIPSK